MAFSLRLGRGFRSWTGAPWLNLGRRAPRRLDRSGAAAVEFAIVGPMLILVLMGVFTYGGYFFTAHTIQQLTNDAARAAIAGLDDDERRTLAQQSLRASIAAQGALRGDLADVTVTRSGQMLTVAVTYDAGDDLYWAFQSLVPAPASRISRRASIQLGGF